MSEHFERYLAQDRLQALSLAVETEKPDTLSYQLAAFVAQVRRFADIKAFNGRGEPMDLHVGVSLQLHGDAFAAAEGGRSYIGITLGHFLASTYFAIEVFFRTHAFLDIGAPPANYGVPMELCPEDGFWDSKGEFVAGFGKLRTSDGERAAGCYFLIYAMSMLAYFHEYYHALLGHCPVMNRLGFAGRLHENGGDVIPTEISRVSRSLEAVADRNAMLLLVKMILDDADFPTASGVIRLDTNNRLRLALVGSGLLTTSWHAWQQRTGKNDSLHPIPSVRFKQFFSATKAALQDKGRDELFDLVGSKAMEDLAKVGLRCPELTSSLWSIAGHPHGPADRIEAVPDKVAAWLDEETYRLR